MDSFSYRSQRPGAARTTANESSTPVHTETTKQQPIHRAITAEPAKRRLSPKLIVIIVAAVALVGLVAWLLRPSSVAPNFVDTSKYQAVFLTDGQVYFGKVKSSNNDYLKLVEVYYPQKKATDAKDKAAEVNTDVQLIKLGGEIQGPEDEMIINKQQVLYIENLKADGMVTKSIKSYSKTQ